MVNTKIKGPEHAWDNDEIVCEQGWVTGEQDGLGSKDYKYCNPDKPEDFSTQKVSATGSYETTQYDKNKKEIRASFSIGSNYNYVRGGTSDHNDGHYDKNTESTSRENCEGDKGLACKTSYVSITDGEYKAVAGNGKYFILDNQKASPLSSTKSFLGTDGDNVAEHAGNSHKAYEKNRVTAVKGNNILMVEEGDYSLHVQKANWDAHIAQQGRLYTGTDLLIESGTKITLKVGGSTIVISPDNITMIATTIDLNP